MFSPAYFDLSQKHRNRRIRGNADIRPRFREHDFCSAIFSFWRIAYADNNYPFNKQYKPDFHKPAQIASISVSHQTLNANRYRLSGAYDIRTAGENKRTPHSA
ncbi:hypothetical protein [Burkholderia sp. RS02]|uniref:hypothetical protein n=1 Tax=unclassified Burkholderia TaxID=2613784 RepID=UPI0032181E9B